MRKHKLKQRLNFNQGYIVCIHEVFATKFKMAGKGEEMGYSI